MLAIVRKNVALTQKTKKNPTYYTLTFSTEATTTTTLNLISYKEVDESVFFLITNAILTYGWQDRVKKMFRKI